MKCITDFDVTYGSALAPAVSAMRQLLLLRMPPQSSAKTSFLSSKFALVVPLIQRSVLMPCTLLTHSKESHATRVNPACVKVDHVLGCY